jgi:hypothetical protein
MPRGSKKQNEERFAYGSVIEALTQGLYPDKKHVIRELVQNCYDGLSELKQKHPAEAIRPVSIKIDGSSIFVNDDGIGMTAQKMREYRYLGFSTKKKHTDAGFRGIGKFSPISLCEKIIVDSSPFGLAQRFRVVIDAEGMVQRINKDNNPPLENLLREHTSFEKADETKAAHYTLVELYRVRKDAQAYLEMEPLKQYLRRTAPLRTDPAFKHSAEIEKKLNKFVPGYLAIDLKLNGERLYKPFLEPCEAPQDRFVHDKDNTDQLLAYSWFCANSEMGQFSAENLRPADNTESRHPDSGIVFRVRNISIGDRFLARRTFWRKSPELSFHFFGELHVINPEVIPSSDRTDFEDNEARQQLYDSAVELASDLNIIRRAESQERNFGKKIAQAQATFSEDSGKLATNTMAVEVKDDHAYKIQKSLEDLRKRLERSKNPIAKSEAKQVLKRGEHLLAKLRGTTTEATSFVDITKELKLNRRMAALYEVIVSTIREELNYDPDKFERLIAKIHDALRAAQL